MQLPPQSIGLHANANQIVGVEEVERLLLGQGHAGGLLMNEHP
jgi:hypothetical protein